MFSYSIFLRIGIADTKYDIISLPFQQTYCKPIGTKH